MHFLEMKQRHPLLPDKSKFSLIFKKKGLKAHATFCGPLTFLLFIRTGGTGSIPWSFPDSCFIMFQVVFILSASSRSL
jgi:hypothetical protein